MIHISSWFKDLVYFVSCVILPSTDLERPVILESGNFHKGIQKGNQWNLSAKPWQQDNVKKKLTAAFQKSIT